MAYCGKRSVELRKYFNRLQDKIGETKSGDRWLEASPACVVITWHIRTLLSAATGSFNAEMTY